MEDTATYILLMSNENLVLPVCFLWSVLLNEDKNKYISRKMQDYLCLIWRTRASSVALQGWHCFVSLAQEAWISRERAADIEKFSILELQLLV